MFACSLHFVFFFFLLLRPPPRSTLFPYTTLFRSHYRGHVLERPRQRERPAAEDEEDNRLSGSDDFLEELFLAPRQTQKSPRSGFAGHLRGIFAERQDGDVGLFCRLDRLFQLVVGTADELCSLGIAKIFRANSFTEGCAQSDYVLGTSLPSP